jgi:nucleoside 2-deoxyribosyltransferase
MSLTKQLKVYLASGWFTPAAAEEVTNLEALLTKMNFDMASPRQIFICPPNASQEVQEATYRGNLHHIETADFVLCNTRDKDMGTIFEAGYASAKNVPIVYFCQGLKGNFNLMLSRSGVKVCTSYEELEHYLTKVQSMGDVVVEAYKGVIE